MAIKKIVKKNIPSFLLNFYHYSLALLSAFLYGFPSRKLTVIGVTGTKGKSTTVMLAGKILEEAGFKISWLTSATIKIGDKEQLNSHHMTMPGRFAIQRFLKESVGAGCKFAILEVTSEGIKQYRHKFINFDTAVFTNLRPEHIEAHGSFENYKKAKLKLFKAVKNIHIVNLDDENAGYFLQLPAKEKYGFGIKNQELRIKNELKIIEARDIGLNENYSSFIIHNSLFKIHLLGEFNIYNALAAICIGLSREIDLETCKRALEKIQTIPGRMEVIIEKPFKVIVDLAHTPDSYEEVFKSIQSIPHNKIISVFGSAGGGRDKWKRPVLGKIAAKFSDFIILCNEDPYDENPNQILSEIKSGISNFQPSTRAKHGAGPVPYRTEGSGAGFPISNLYEILDRRKAIKKGLELAKENDIVLLLGKGTEQLIIIGNKKISWDDRNVAREELQRLSLLWGLPESPA